MHKGRQTRLLAILAALSIAAVGCSSAVSSVSTGSSASAGGNSASAGSAGQSSPFKIAFVADLTGPVGVAAGLPARAGFMSAVSYIDAHGGADGHRLNVTVMDSQSSPTAAQAAFEQAASGGYNGISSEVNSSEQVAANEVLSAAGIPVVSTATDQTITNASWWYSVGPTSSAQASSALEVATALLGTLKGKKIAIAALNDAAGGGFVSQVQAAAQAAGATVVAVSQDPSTITSFTSQATTIESHHPDVVFTFNTTTVATMEQKALYDAGLTTQPLIGALQTYNATTLAANKLPNSYAVLASVAQPSSSSLSVTTARAAGFGNTDFTNAFFAQAWAAAFVLANILGTCGASCPIASFDKIANSARYSVPGNLLLAVPKFTSANHYGLAAVQAFRWNAGSNSVTSASKVLPLVE
jgi:ABC-type branched-subunit amino acid transport system substrate-binding protein